MKFVINWTFWNTRNDQKVLDFLNLLLFYLKIITTPVNNNEWKKSWLVCLSNIIFYYKKYKNKLNIFIMATLRHQYQSLKSSSLSFVVVAQTRVMSNVLDGQMRALQSKQLKKIHFMMLADRDSNWHMTWLEGFEWLLWYETSNDIGILKPQSKRVFATFHSLKRNID